MALKIFFTITLSLLITLTSATSVVDFCVADLSLPKGPFGYPCKNPANLKADDFVFSGFGVPGNTSNFFKAAVTPAVDNTFPALNGLGISAARIDLAVGGVIPIHSHRVSELLIVVEGTVIGGFVASDDTVYYKTLKKGDIMIFPHSLFHFLINTGSTPALGFVSLNSASPGLHQVDTALFGNALPTQFVQKVSLLDAAQVQKLKKAFGGTN